MAIHEIQVYHFHEFIEVVGDIGRTQNPSSNKPSLLWARGHRRRDWNLRPTLFRDIALSPISGVANSSKRALEEELRKEHYIAKNYHFIEKELKTSLEWMEVMQHHGVKTRLLDWSESILHSLTFALECFLDNEKYHSDERINSSPCVWIMKPIEWNMQALELILNNDNLIQTILDSNSGLRQPQKNNIKRRINDLKSNFRTYMDIQSAQHLKGIFNLSSILSDTEAMRSKKFNQYIEQGDLYNGLFFLILNIYLSSNLQEIRDVMPLAIVESYHSERIKAQRGAFTIFPYYKENAQYASASKLGIPLDAMEYMSNCNQNLYKILLCNPEEIAYEIMNAGLNVSWLYPEMPVVANAIEKREIFT